MNKDLDERLVPNGEYRDALNVEIASSEGSDIGSVQTLKSNVEIQTLIQKHSSSFTVGSYVDESGGCIYKFIKDASNFNTTFVGGIAKQTGVRSDLIEKINANNTDYSYNTDSEIVIHDVYEVRMSADEFQVDGNNLVIIQEKGLTYQINAYSSEDNTSFRNLRPGMTVEAIDLAGINSWRGAETVLIKKIKKDFANIVIELTSMPIEIEGDISNQIVYKFSAPRILNFSSGTSSQKELNTELEQTTPTPVDSLITSINLLDEYLLFTDGRNEPKKINVERAILGSLSKTLISGSPEDFSNYSTVPHTHLVSKIKQTFYDKGFLEEHHITTIKRNPLQAPEIDLVLDNSTASNSNIQFSLYGDYYGYASNVSSFDFYNDSGENLGLGSVLYLIPTTLTGLSFTENQTIVLTGSQSALSFTVRVTNVYSTNAIRVQVIGVNEDYFENIPIGTVEENWFGKISSKSQLYTEKFVRFAYRYRYTDNEYSCISPYSEPAFVPGNYSYDSAFGFNEGMENNIDFIKIKNLQKLIIPQDVKAVEFLFKVSGSENVHAFKEVSVKAQNINSLYLNNFYSTKYLNKNELTVNSIDIETENFGYTLPSDQLIRVSDAVPIRAKAQSIQANRLMYGNYTEGYDMKDSNNSNIDFNITAGIDQRDNNFTSSFTSENVFRATQNAEFRSSALNTGDGTGSYFSGGDENNTPLFVSETFKTESEIYDSQNNYNTATNVFTAPEDGLYTFRFTAKALIKTRVSGNVGYTNPKTYIDIATGEFKGNIGVRRHALGIGPVTAAGKPKHEIFDPTSEESNLFVHSTYLGATNAQATYNIIVEEIVVDSDVIAPTETFLNPPSQYSSINNLLELTVGQRLNTGVSLDQDSFPETQIEESVPSNGYGLTIGDTVDPRFKVKGKYVDEPVGDQRLIEITADLQLQEGEKIGAFAFTDQGPASQVTDESAELVFFKDATFECLSAPQSNDITVDSLQGVRSIKSERNYHFGVVYSDENGRESSVVISEENDIFLEKSFADKQNALTTLITSKAPSWAKTYKIYIKETAVKYHNLVLDAAILNADESSTTAFLLFNIADKDKVKIGDFLSIKKKQGSNQAVLDTAKWKVLDIQGSATFEQSDVEGISGGTITIGSANFDQFTITNPAQISGKFFVKVAFDDNFIEYIGDLSGGPDTAINTGSTNGAVFETVKDSNIDIDLYYEASEALPIRVTNEFANILAKPGNKIVLEPVNYSGTMPSIFTSAKTTPLRVGFGPASAQGAFSESAICYNNNGDLDNKVKIQVGSHGSLSDYSLINIDGFPNKVLVKFVRPDGSFMSAFLSENYNPSTDNFIYLNPVIHPTASHPSNACPISLPWFNVYAFGNGVESDTIKDDFNETEIFPYLAAGKQSGFKANLPVTEFEQSIKKNEIIFSELYNEKTSTNRLNEFLAGTGNTKILNPDYGSIQKLFSRNNDLLAFCEDKVIKILSQKDALFNADGNLQLTATNKVLGQSIPFKADYGISKNPESFAYDAYKAYFVDRSRGAVLRLSNDGITVISNYGMKDWFRDQLKLSEVAIGSFDGRKGEYNLTLHEVTDPARFKNVYTVSFNESINGWTSFKSFIQESGYTLGNEYYTSKNGRTYLHHSDLQPRNNFYNFSYNSSITPLFNDDPSSVKSFRSIYYEGTQSKVNEFNTVTQDGVQYTDNNYYNLNEKQGWFVSSIKTNLQEGTIQEFIEKEGKWFNYIKGETTEFVNSFDNPLNNNLDLSELSVQGLGVLTEDPVLILAEDEDEPQQGFNVTFLPSVPNLVDGEIEQINVGWNELNEAISSEGLTLYNVNSFTSAQGNLNQEIIISPNPNFQIDANSFETIEIVEGTSLDNFVTNINISNATDGSGNVIIELSMNPGSNVTNDVIISLPIVLTSANNLAGLLSTQLTYNIQESVAFDNLLSADATVADAYVENPFTQYGVQYYLVQNASIATEALTNWTETGSYEINSTTSGNGQQYLHSIVVYVPEGQSYIQSGGSFNLTLIPNILDQGQYDFNYTYTNDNYGNLYQITIDVFYTRFVGSELSIGTQIILDMDEDAIVDYFATPTISTITQLGYFLQIPEAASTPIVQYETNIPNDTNAPGGANTGNLNLNFEYTGFETNWLEIPSINANGSIEIMTDTQFNFFAQALEPLPNNRQAFIQLYGWGYSNVLLNTIYLSQDDEPAINMVIKNVNNVGVTDGYLVSNPNTSDIQYGEQGDYLYEIELITDSNAFLDSINAQFGNILLEDGLSPNWIYFADAEGNVNPVDENQNNIAFFLAQPEVGDVGTYKAYFYVRNNLTQEQRTATFKVQHPNDATLSAEVFLNQDGAYNSAIDTQTIQLGSGGFVGGTNNFVNQTEFLSDHTINSDYILSKTEDPLSDVVNVRIDTEYGGYGIDQFNLPPLGYGKPNAIFSSDSGSGEYLTLTDEDLLGVDSLLINSAQVQGVGGGLSWQHQIAKLIQENTTILDRIIQVYCYHPKNTAWNVFSGDLPISQQDHDAVAQIIQGAAPLVFAWYLQDQTYFEAVTEGFSSTLAGLDSGEQFNHTLVTQNFESINPQSVRVFLVYSGDIEPTIAFWDVDTGSYDTSLELIDIGGDYTGFNVSPIQSGTNEIATIEASDDDSTQYNVYYFDVTYTDNEIPFQQQDTIGIWHPSNVDQDGNPTTDPNRILNFTQDALAYDNVVNNLEFVNNNAERIESFTIGNDAGTAIFKVIVGDYTQEDFEQEVLDADNEYPIGNKIPRFTMVHQDGGEPLDIDAANVPNIAVTKNPNFPEGIGTNYIDFSAENLITAFLSEVDNTPQTVADLNGALLGFAQITSNVIGDATSNEIMLLNTFADPVLLFFTPSIWPAETFNPDPEAVQNFKFVFEYEIANASANPPALFIVGLENLGGSLTSQNIALPTTVGTHKVIVPIDNGQNVDANNIGFSVTGQQNTSFRIVDPKLRILSYTHEIEIPHTDNFSIENEVYELNGFHAWNNTNTPNDFITVTKKQADNYNFVNPTVSFDINIGVDEESQIIFGNDALITNTTINLEFNFRSLSATRVPILRFLDPDDESKIFNGQTFTVVEEPIQFSQDTNVFAALNEAARPLPRHVQSLFYEDYDVTPSANGSYGVGNATTTPNFREINFSGHLLQASGGTFGYSEDQDGFEFNQDDLGITLFDNPSVAVNNSIDPQLDDVVATLNEGDQSATDLNFAEFEFFNNTLEVAQNFSNALRIGVNHQRYLDTFVRGGGDSTFRLRTSSKYFSNVGSDGEFDVPGVDKVFKIAAFANSPYPNLVNLTDTSTFNIIDFVNSDGQTNSDTNSLATINILGSDSLTWNTANVVEGNQVTETTVNNATWGYKLLQFTLPEAGAQYRISFTIKNWKTKDNSGVQIDTKERLLQTDSVPDAYPITISNIDMLNGRHFVDGFDDSIKVGPEDGDEIELTTLFDNNLNVLNNNFIIHEDFAHTFISSEYSSRIKNTASVGNNHFCYIVRSGNHVNPNISLVFRNHVSFTMESIAIEKVTDAYRHTLTDDPLGDGADISNLQHPPSDIFTVTQNPFFANQATVRFINGTDVLANGGSAGSINNSPIVQATVVGSSVADTYNQNLVAEHSAIVPADTALRLQFRSKKHIDFNSSSNPNQAFMAVSVDGGVTFKTSTTLAADGISTGGSGAAALPDGDTLSGSNTMYRKYNPIDIPTNLASEDLVDENGDVVPSSPRTFIFALFNAPQLVSSSTGNVSSSKFPVATYSITQLGSNQTVNDFVELSDPEGIFVDPSII